MYALVLCAERFGGSYVIVSDCLGVVKGAQALLDGGKPSPTSRHADLWTRLHAALRGRAAGDIRVRWVPSHEKRGSTRISEEDRWGNQEADSLANAEARRIGPMHRQQEK